MKVLRSLFLCSLGVNLLLGLVPTLLAETAESPLDVSIEAFVVTVDEEGTEQFTPAEEALPNAIILYRATYRNTGERTLKNILPRIPVPSELDYIEGSASPRPAAVSIDGEAFEAYDPIALDPAEGTALRAVQWAFPELAPGAVCVVEFRAHIPG